MLNKFLTGATYTLEYEFFDQIGRRVDVENPIASVLTPQNVLYGSFSLAPISDATTGTYSHDLFIPIGLTLGNWVAIPSGVTQGTTLFADPFPFEVMNFQSENNWINVRQLRTFLEEDEEDHSNDGLFRLAIHAAMNLIEEKTRQKWGISTTHETFQINWSSAKQLRRYPVINITGLTATICGYTPRDSDNPNTESNAGEVTPFFYRMGPDNSTLIFTDSDGYQCDYGDTIVTIEYSYGKPDIPESISLAAIMLSSRLLNLMRQEGVDNLRIGDMNFSMSRNLFDGEIGSLLKLHTGSI